MLPRSSDPRPLTPREVAVLLAVPPTCACRQTAVKIASYALGTTESPSAARMIRRELSSLVQARLVVSTQTTSGWTREYWLLPAGVEAADALRAQPGGR